jgi:hypothetical protein
MRSSHWVVIAVVGAFMGFLLGYGVPALIDVGLKGEVGKPAAKSQKEKALADYYRQLQEEEQ